MKYESYDCLADEPVSKPGPQVIAKMDADKRGGAANCFYVFAVPEEELGTPDAIEPKGIQVETKDTIPGQCELF